MQSNYKSLYFHVFPQKCPYKNGERGKLGHPNKKTRQQTPSTSINCLRTTPFYHVFPMVFAHLFPIHQPSTSACVCSPSAWCASARFRQHSKRKRRSQTSSPGRVKPRWQRNAEDVEVSSKNFRCIYVSIWNYIRWLELYNIDIHYKYVYYIYIYTHFLHSGRPLELLITI